MRQHLHELKDIDDSNHHVSFYSQETTLGGIRATCELVDSGLLQEMDVHDILQLLGIVGIACKAQVGPFPDPMTYRIHKVYPGCKISLADVITAHIVSHGGSLEVRKLSHLQRHTFQRELNSFGSNYENNLRRGSRNF